MQQASSTVTCQKQQNLGTVLVPVLGVVLLKTARVTYSLYWGVTLFPYCSGRLT